MKLLDVLASSPDLQWRVARVKRIFVGPPYRVDLVVGSLTESEATIGAISGAAVLNAYSPVVGDVVHVLVHTNIGALVLGPARTAAPAAALELPRVSQFYGGNAPYNVTYVDGVDGKQSLGGTTMTNPDPSRYILARGDLGAWGTTTANTSGYLTPTTTGAAASTLAVNDGRLPHDLYQAMSGSIYFTIAPKATTTFRATASRSTDSGTFTVNYLRVTIAALSWRSSGTI